jgi:DNA-binding NarL/FixJ family response regulator
MSEQYNLLLVDDQTLASESLKAVLQNYAEDMNVIGIAKNIQDAVDMAESLRPDIVLMDAHTPEMGCVEAARLIKQKRPEIKILILSAFAEDEFVRAALLAGASGYLLKNISPPELIAAIRALKNNIMQISPEIVRKMAGRKSSDEIQDEAGDLKTRHSLWLKTLTKREREVFALLADGYDNEKIAETLFLAQQTVKNHVSVIYSKLGVKDRFEIIRRAKR